MLVGGVPTPDCMVTYWFPEDVKPFSCAYRQPLSKWLPIAGLHDVGAWQTTPPTPQVICFVLMDALYAYGFLTIVVQRLGGKNIVREPE